jgi:TusA-related sulfurtransferase
MTDIPGKHWRADDGVHLDVRGLAPPEPMVAILEVIDQLENQTLLIVHHFRDPVYIYPELAERGWRCEIVDGEPDEVRLHVRKTT